MRVSVVAHGAPGLPGDAQDHEGDGEADEDDAGAGDDGEAGVGVGAGVGAVGDQGGAVEPVAGARADQRGNPVAREADCAGGGERPSAVGSCGSITRATAS